MSVPTVKVEVAFASDPLDDDPTWTDITTYVEGQAGTTISRGRSDEFDQVAASTLTLTLNNADGRFTPNNASSPYSPNVTVGKRIRITCVWQSTTYSRIYGYINGWPVNWENGMLTSIPVQITATDRFKRMSTAGPLVSALEHEVLTDDPEMYYVLNEEDGSLAAGNTSYTSHGPATVHTLGSGTLTFGSGTGPTDGMTAAVWDAPHDDDTDLPKHTAGNAAWLTKQFSPTITLDASSGAATIECWSNPTKGTPSSSYRFVSIYDNIRKGKVSGFIPALVMGEDLSGHFFARATGLDTDNDINPTYLNSPILPDGKTHHFAVALIPNTSGIILRMYMDGVQVLVTTGGTSDYEAVCNTLHIGEDGFAADGDSFLGTESHVAVYTFEVGADRIAQHFEAGDNGFTGDMSGDRIMRIAGYVDTPVAQTNIESGLSVLGPAVLRDQNPVDAMQQVALNENGIVFIDRDGNLAFHGRTHRYNVDSSFTLHADDNVLGADTSFQMDDQYLKNDIRVSRQVGPSLRRFDQDSIDAAGRYEDDLDLLTADDDEAADAATYRVQAYGTPQPRISDLVINLHELSSYDSGNLVASLLAMELGDRITVDGLPSTAPASSVDLWVEGYTEVIGVNEWTMTITTSPVLTQQDEVWVLGVSGHSELGTTTYLGY